MIVASIFLYFWYFNRSIICVVDIDAELYEDGEEQMAEVTAVLRNDGLLDGNLEVTLYVVRATERENQTITAYVKAQTTATISATFEKMEEGMVYGATWDYWDDTK